MRKIAKNQGKKFEEDIASSCKGFYFYRLRDSASSFDKDNMARSKVLRFTIKNDYDCLLFFKNSYFGLELKSTKSTSFSFSRDDKKEKARQIKNSQIRGLNNCGCYDGCHAGFILNFRNKERNPKLEDTTYWLNIHNFNIFMEETTKKSINEEDVVSYGGIKIDSRLKQVRSFYNVAKLCEEVISKESDIIDKLKFDMSKYQKELGFE